MNHEERIRQLEEQLESEEGNIKALFLRAKIPKPEDYVEGKFSFFCCHSPIFYQFKPVQYLFTLMNIGT